MLKIGPELVFSIRPLREEPRGIKLTQVERSGPGETLYRAGQLKIQKEESVISHVPEAGDSGVEGSLQSPSGQAMIAFSSMSMAAPNCPQSIVFQLVSNFVLPQIAVVDA